MWQFDKIREYAIEKMSKIEIALVKKICLARDYHVTEWLLPSLNAYAKLQDTIRVDDVSSLGLGFVFRIVEVRESTVVTVAFYSNCQSQYCQRGAHFNCRGANIHDRQRHDFTAALREAFQVEIKLMEDSHCQPVDASKATEGHGQEGDSFHLDDVVILVS
jgi:hypothetical protein